METPFIELLATEGSDGTVGANELAHAATHTGMGRVTLLVDAVVECKNVTRLLHETHGDVEGTLPVDT